MRLADPNDLVLKVEHHIIAFQADIPQIFPMQKILLQINDVII